MSPRPTAAAIARAYDSYYTHGETTEWWTGDELAGPRRLAALMAYGRLNSRLGYDRRPAVGAGAFLLPLLVRRDSELLGHLRYLRARAGGRLLDVGCGEGSYLRLMRSLGWSSVGVDPDPRAVRVARAAGLDVHLGTIDEIALADGSFDAITLNHSIEHVHDPVGLLAECRRLLAPRGELVVYTPNLESDGHKRFGRDWLHLDPPRHLVIFTPTALRRVLEVVGFREVQQLPARLRGASARASAALRADADPWDPPPLSLGLRLVAAVSNLRALRDPARAEEVALRALR